MPKGLSGLLVRCARGLAGGRADDPSDRELEAAVQQAAAERS